MLEPVFRFGCLTLNCIPFHFTTLKEPKTLQSEDYTNHTYNEYQPNLPKAYISFGSYDIFTNLRVIVSSRLSDSPHILASLYRNCFSVCHLNTDSAVFMDFCTNNFLELPSPFFGSFPLSCPLENSPPAFFCKTKFLPKFQNIINLVGRYSQFTFYFLQGQT